MNHDALQPNNVASTPTDEQRSRRPRVPREGVGAPASQRERPPATGHAQAANTPKRTQPRSTVLLTQLVARLFLPASAMVAAATLVKGYSDTGDGFSAGVILSLGVLLQFVAFGYRATIERYPFLTYAAPITYVGLLLAFAVAFVPVLRGDPVMTHYPRPGAHVAHIGSIEFHTAVLFDLAVFLIVFGFCVGALGFIARMASSNPFGRALSDHAEEQSRADQERQGMVTLNEAISPVRSEPMRPTANRHDGERK